MEGATKGSGEVGQYSMDGAIRDPLDSAVRGLGGIGTGRYTAGEHRQDGNCLSAHREGTAESGYDVVPRCLTDRQGLSAQP